VTGDHAWEIARTILNIGRAIEQLGTGGALWVLAGDRPIPEELADCGRGVGVGGDWWEAFREEWENRTAVIRLLNPGCDQGHEFLQDAAQLWDFVRRASVLESIASLAGVDGAILINASPDVLAFNVVCNAFPAQTEILQAIDPMRPLVGGKLVERSTFGGSRHQSAIDFCSALAPAGALVASHDGGLTVFASHEKGRVFGSKVSLIQSDSEVRNGTEVNPSQQTRIQSSGS
jgi:hypothetical protein